MAKAHFFIAAGTAAFAVMCSLIDIGPSTLQSQRVLGLSPAGLEEEEESSRSASEMGRLLKGLVVEPSQRGAPSPAPDAPPLKIPSDIQNKDPILKGLWPEPHEPAVSSHNPCVGVLGRSPVPCGPSGNLYKPIQLPAPGGPEPTPSSSAPDVSSPK